MKKDTGIISNFFNVMIDYLNDWLVYISDEQCSHMIQEILSVRLTVKKMNETLMNIFR